MIIKERTIMIHIVEHPHIRAQLNALASSDFRKQPAQNRMSTFKAMAMLSSIRGTATNHNVLGHGELTANKTLAKTPSVGTRSKHSRKHSITHTMNAFPAFSSAAL